MLIPTASATTGILPGNYEDDCFLVYLKGESDLEFDNSIADLINGEIEKSRAMPIMNNASTVVAYNRLLTISLVENGKEAVSSAISAIYDSFSTNENFIEATPNYIAYTDSTYSANDLYYTGNNDYSFSDTGIHFSKINKLWDLSTGSQDLVVAIIDSGINLQDPDLIPNIWTNPGEIPGNNIDDDQNGFIDDVHGWNFANGSDDVTDYIDHGTLVSSLIGARGNNNIGMAGACWNVKLTPLKTYDESLNGVSLEAVIDALYYAQNFAVPILNMSESFSYFSNALKQAVDNYAGLLICSAGNDRVDLDSTGIKRYPACFNNSNIISVGGISYSDQLNCYNWGKTSVDLGALSKYVSIYSPKKVLTDGMFYCSGTSFSTPLVTETAALLKSIKPSASTSQIKAAILNGVDYNQSYENYFLSSGKLNAQKAVTYFTIYGDVNNDGLINSNDISLLRTHIFNGNYLTGKSLVAADVNRDGVISVSDLNAIQNHISGTAKIYRG